MQVLLQGKFLVVSFLKSLKHCILCEGEGVLGGREGGAGGVLSISPYFAKALTQIL
jgi:hypothetical protein